AVATATALDLFGDEGVAYATGAMTLVVLIFGEVTPKGFASANADRVARAVAPTILLLSRLLFPVVRPLESLTRWFVSRSHQAGRTTFTQGEILEMHAIAHL